MGFHADLRPLHDRVALALDNLLSLVCPFGDIGENLLPHQCALHFTLLIYSKRRSLLVSRDRRRQDFEVNSRAVDPVRLSWNVHGPACGRDPHKNRESINSRPDVPRGLAVKLARRFSFRSELPGCRVPFGHKGQSECIEMGLLRNSAPSKPASKHILP
jgi:hypothetical protein